MDCNYLFFVQKDRNFDFPTDTPNIGKMIQHMQEFVAEEIRTPIIHSFSVFYEGQN